MSFVNYMKVSGNNNYLNFKGFKNVISNDLRNDKARFSFFAAELTNDGINDLDEYKKLLKMMGEEDTDVLSVIYSRIDNQDVLMLNGKKLFWGNELKLLNKHFPENLYKNEENNAMKAYTIIASITNRMMKNGLADQDSEFKKVFSHFFKVLQSIVPNKAVVMEILENAAIKNRSVDIVGELFNKIARKSMEQFFK